MDLVCRSCVVRRALGTHKMQWRLTLTEYWCRIDAMFGVWVEAPSILHQFSIKVVSTLPRCYSLQQLMDQFSYCTGVSRLLLRRIAQRSWNALCWILVLEIPLEPSWSSFLCSEESKLEGSWSWGLSVTLAGPKNLSVRSALVLAIHKLVADCAVLTRWESRFRIITTLQVHPHSVNPSAQILSFCFVLC
jgi:hypothetical protein